MRAPFQPATVPDMTDAATIAADPHWLPHTLDLASGRMLFVRISREALTGAGFLADVKPEEAEGAQWLGLADVRAMRPEPGGLHFIFHTAFCRSTLLARALNIEGVSVGMAEPGIIAQLAGAGEAARDLVKPVCDLLARPWGEGQAVFVKPTNRANMLIPALLAARPDARAVLMTNPLETFLASVDRRAIMGRRWGRQLYLEVMGYAGMDLGMDGREQFLMTDLQAAGAAWFLSQRMYAAMMAGPDKARLATLDGDCFDGARARTIAAVLDFAGVGHDAPKVEAIADGPLFRSHAKLGGDYAGEADTASASFRQEVEQVGQWIGMIAQQAGVEVPVRQTLF